MAKYLQAYVDGKNRFARVFKTPEINLANLDAKGKAALIDMLDGELSPENLCCDGELRGPALRAKARMLNGAMAEAQALVVNYK